MARNPPRTRRPRTASRGAPLLPRESRAAEAATVAWTVSVTTALMCDLAAIVGHWVVAGRPDAQGAVMFRELLLLAGAIVGVGSLVLLAVVYRIRQTPPPTGFVVFAVCAAMAPIVALSARAAQ